MEMLFATADLSDAFEACCSSCETQLKQYGGWKIFCGRIRTIKCLNDNVLLRRMLETRSEGDVLVVDGSGSLSSALIGDMIAGMAAKNGWSVAVIFGAVRDSRVLASLDFGISALGSNPRKSAKMGTGSVDVVVAFGGATITPGHWVYVDEDGILVSDQKLVGI
jgi:regulator of ribonuclease activity A